jgi:hypothetical protein
MKDTNAGYARFQPDSSHSGQMATVWTTNGPQGKKAFSFTVHTGVTGPIMEERDYRKLEPLQAAVKSGVTDYLSGVLGAPVQVTGEMGTLTGDRKVGFSVNTYDPAAIRHLEALFAGKVEYRGHEPSPQRISPEVNPDLPQTLEALQEGVDKAVGLVVQRATEQGASWSRGKTGSTSATGSTS